MLFIAFIVVADLIDGGKGVLPAALWQAPAWAPWWYAPWRMFCNALPGLMLAGVILALTRRAGLAWVVGMAFEILLAVINVLKVKNLGSPLLPADFLMVGQLGGGGGDLLAGYLPRSPWPWVGIVGFIVILVLLALYEPPLIRRRWYIRGPVALLLVAALASLVAGWQAWGAVYNARYLGMQPWSPKATRAHAGLVSSLMLFHLKYSKAHDKPDVDAALALMSAKYDAVRQREKAIAAEPGDKPDIIVILSESLFDPTILKGYGANVDLLPHLHRLARHGISGWMYPPTFGGGTIRTGFEVMTGLSLRYFPDIQFPWLQIHQKAIPGIVRLLKSRGYSAIAVHGNDPAFWNRTSAFKALGFDRFVSISDFPPDDRVDDGKYMSDKSFTDELLRQLKSDGPPQFVYGLSIEAHGPYNRAYGIDAKVRDAIPVPASVTGDHRTHLQNYIYHIRHADEQLGRLVDALKKRKRRTIVVFFGDHLPALVPAFQDAGFKNGKNFFMQQVPYLIYDTGHPDAAPVKRNVAAWMLPGIALAKAGITHTPYYALTDILGPKLANLSRAPDAPQVQPTPEQTKLENGLRNVSRLRLESKLDPLWAKAKASANNQALTANSASTATPPAASTVQRNRPATSEHPTQKY
ncbi:MAG TPA: LTA synthase family protein [Rhodanobacteraceae bacterium]|nr:LTA synthase family protein [Rhodanobacteraceae bacterium]